MNRLQSVVNPYNCSAVKALEGKNHHELRELDEQFAAFQQIVTSRTPHLSGSGSVEGSSFNDLLALCME